MTENLNFAAITIHYEIGKTFSSIGQDLITPMNRFLDLCNQLEIKITLMVEMGQYLELKDQYPEISDQISQQWQDAHIQGHDLQLLLHAPITPSLIQKSKEALEALLQPLNSHYQVVAFRLGNSHTQPYKEIHDALVENGIYCDSSVNAASSTLAYSTHQPYFANPYFPELQAPSSEKTLVELPIFNPIKNRPWILDTTCVKKLLKYLRRQSKKQLTLPQQAWKQKIKTKLAHLYFKLSRLNPLIHQLLSSHLAKILCDNQPEKLVDNQYFVMTGNHPNLRSITKNLNALKKKVKFLTLSMMAETAKQELLRITKKDTLEEKGSPKDFSSLMDEECHQAKSYYLKSLIPWDRKAVLDFGCNTGYWTDCIAKTYPWISQVVGIDNKDTLIQKAQDHYSNKRVSFLRENLGKMSFEDKSFDCVYANATLGHTCDVNSTLKEIHRVLKVGGVLIALIPSNGRNPQKANPYHIWKTLPKEAQMRLKDNGFMKIEIEEINAYKTFAMPPYPPGNDYLMFIRAWKLPSESPILTRIKGAIDWIQTISPSLLSQELASLAPSALLRRLLERENYTLSYENTKMIVNRGNTEYTLDSGNTEFFSNPTGLK